MLYRRAVVDPMVNDVSRSQSMRHFTIRFQCHNSRGDPSRMILDATMPSSMHNIDFFPYKYVHPYLLAGITSLMGSFLFLVVEDALRAR